MQEMRAWVYLAVRSEEGTFEAREFRGRESVSVLESLRLFSYKLRSS